MFGFSFIELLIALAVSATMSVSALSNLPAANKKLHHLQSDWQQLINAKRL